MGAGASPRVRRDALAGTAKHPRTVGEGFSADCQGLLPGGSSIAPEFGFRLVTIPFDAILRFFDASVTDDGG
jgi:hypothetical protein